MIITGGEAKGRRIASPEGLAVRPTASKIRQAIFNILGARTADARFLDIFAGTGLIGLEALSRGAAQLTAVEENRKMTRAIQTSLQMLQFEAQVICADFRQVLPSLPKHSYDIIFADPPYKSPLAGSVLQTVDRCDLLAPQGIMLIEHVKGYELPENLRNLTRGDTRHYGQTGISFFQRAEDSGKPPAQDAGEEPMADESSA